ncbi:MAG: glycerol-3-phosphate 1-O-acyltransferase PlsY [Chloroflexota bacterium]|nr:glycerol-3-phosphate 1-O-acyltransferase PlsY [Chloroflexota bacterium]
MDWLTLFGLAFLSYFIGAFPTGVVLGKLFKGVDLRQHGSGKTGATNSLRTLGWQISLLVFLIDMGKGAVSVWLAQLLFAPEYQPWAVLVTAVLCMLGHDYSIFIGFSGGRGAASGLGELLAVSPLAVLFITLFGLPALLITRYVSLASILGSALAPVGILFASYITGLDWRYLFFAAAAGGMIIIKHADNIQRLLNGTERKLGQKAGTSNSKPAPSNSKEKQSATK